MEKIKYSSQGEKKGINSQPIKRQRMSDTLAHRYHGWDNRANGKGFEKSRLKVNKTCGATLVKHGYNS